MKRAARWLFVLALLAVAVEADARVGGGQGFSTGGGGGFSGGGGGGDGDGLGLILYLIIRLCIEHPTIGIPLLMFFAVAMAIRWWWMQRDDVRQVHRLRETRERVHRAAQPAAESVIAPLVARDPGFSRYAFEPFVQQVHRRALHAAVRGDFSALTPFISPAAQDQLTTAVAGATDIGDVVHAGIRIGAIDTRRGRDAVTVHMMSSRVEQRDGRVTPVYIEETWRFERDLGADSLPPEDALRLGCPSCGAAVETDLEGRCGYCGTAVTAGQLQWQASSVQVDVRRPISPPTVGRFVGGDEPGVHVPTVVDPNLATAYRRFQGEHADFDQVAFLSRAKGIFVELQAAWSAMDWDRARPYVSDTLYETLRFQIEQYASAGLSNRVDRLEIARTDLVKIGQDAWYDAITVRFWASSLDWVEDADGKVVGGNNRVQRNFSEYWTFLRATGSGASAHGIGQCPSCGAALDRVNASGVCEYCDSRIVSGHFDWVLARIDQPQVYRG